VAARNPYLDAIRAAAIILVVFHHLAGVVQMPEWLWLLSLRGYIGVDLFFVLSGWLIGGQLFRAEQRTGRLELGRFWVRRWARTLPAYYAVLLGGWGLSFIGGREWPGGVPLTTVSSLLFAQNYMSPWTFPISWSLCIEEHFYLVFPLVLLVVRRQRWLATSAAVVFLFVSPALRWLAFDGMMSRSWDDYTTAFYMPTHLRLDGLVVGVLFAAAKEHETAVWGWCERHASSVALAGLVLLLTCSYNPWAFAWTEQDRRSWFGAVPHFLGVSLGVGMLLPAAVAPRAASPRWWPVGATWIAEHAYALYLLHLTAFAGVLQACISLNLRTEGMVVALMVAGTVASSWALRRFVERPGLALRDRWEARRAAAPGASLA